MTLAAAGDFDPTYVSLLERGRRVPSFIAVVRLAEALQMSPVRLFADGVDRLSGDEAIGVRTLYRAAYQPEAGRFTEDGTIYPDFEAVVSRFELENTARREVGQPELTHVAEYVRARCIKFTR